MDKETARKKYQLNYEQIGELQKRYYDGESTKKLIADFDLQGLQPSQITYLFDNIVADIVCAYCNIPMEKEPPTRTSPDKDIICPQCGHTVYDSKWRSCSCANCKKKADEQKKKAESEKNSKEELQEKGICKCLDLEHEKKLYESDLLTAWEKLLLGALIEFTMDEDLEYIQPLERFSRTLLSDADKSLNILKELYHRGILILGNRYYTDAFTLNEKYQVQSFTVNRVFYEIWVDDESVVKELLNPKQFLTPEQILLFWKDFNKAEAIKFLLNEFQKIKINNFSPGKKTEEVFGAMVEQFSLSQIFRMIKYVTDKTAKDILSGEKYYQHAANSTITRLESYYKRALHENYSLYNVRYENDLSMITIVK
jgi:hypothetical protein